MEVYVALVCVCFILWLIWRKKHTSQFKNLGVPGPEPNLIFGNMLELYSKGPIKCHEEWVAKYGRIVGYFYGMKPVLLITDPQLLKNIFIKDFSKFMNREPFSPISEYSPHEKYGQSVLILPGKAWKSVRSTLTPTFTSAKMKLMAGSITSSIDTMVNIMKERAEGGKAFDIFDMYKRLTMDVITRTAFGVRTDVQTNTQSQLLKASQLLFSLPFKSAILFFGLCFPAFKRLTLKIQGILLGILNRGIKPDNMLRKGIHEVLDHRRNNPQARKADLLQLLIDAKVPTEVDEKKLEAGNLEIEIASEKDDTENLNKSEKKLSDTEIVSSAATVLLAGYETTSTALGFTTYLLAKHQDVQQRLFEEIQDLVQSGEQLKYETVNKLQYLDKVLNESMRLYPPVFLFTNRYCLEEVQYGDLRIPVGTLICAPVYLMHHDPDFWTDPEVFDPERFNTKPNANGITYLPFGVGPRNCLGMRFAQLEAKLALANVIYRYKVQLADSEQENLKIMEFVRTLTPADPVKVKLEIRNNES